MLNSSVLRQIWLIIEQTQAFILLELSDGQVLRQIQAQLEAQVFLTASEYSAANNYIQSKVPLIRDLASSRLAVA